MEQAVRLYSAEWDLRPKTKFLRIAGAVTVQSPQDDVQVEKDPMGGFNPTIFVLRISVTPSGGPVKPQPMPFYFIEETTGTEGYLSVQARAGAESDTIPITILEYAIARS